jgi:hypothetical protein
VAPLSPLRNHSKSTNGGWLRAGHQKRKTFLLLRVSAYTYTGVMHSGTSSIFSWDFINQSGRGDIRSENCSSSSFHALPTIENHQWFFARGGGIFSLFSLIYYSDLIHCYRFRFYISMGASTRLPHSVHEPS